MDAGEQTSFVEAPIACIFAFVAWLEQSDDIIASVPVLVQMAEEQRLAGFAGDMVMVMKLIEINGWGGRGNRRLQTNGWVGLMVIK